MAKRSRIFMISAVLLVLVDLGLAAGLVFQRQQSSTAHDRVLLEAEKSQLAERLTVARAIEQRLPDLEARFVDLRARRQEIEPRLYVPAQQSRVEAILTDLMQQPGGKAAGAQIQRIVTSVTDEVPPLREHTFEVYAYGRMTVLPLFADGFFAEPRLGVLTRFAASSADFRFRDLEMVVRAHHYEVVIPEDAGPSEKEVEGSFDVVVPGAEQAHNNAGLADLAAEIDTTRAALTSLKPALVKAANLEAQIRLHEQLVAEFQALSQRSRDNKLIVEDNLPKLYLRVRNSPLGGAALLIEGDKVTFPDYTGEE